MAYFELLYRHSYTESEGMKGKSQPQYTVYGTKFESGISQKPKRNVT